MTPEAMERAKVFGEFIRSAKYAAAGAKDSQAELERIYADYLATLVPSGDHMENDNGTQA